MTLTTTDAGHSDAANRKNLSLLVQLRWIAVTGQLLTILTVHFGLGISLPLVPMLLLLAALVALNLVSISRLKTHTGDSHGALFFALMLDVLALTAQLYLSGGAANPFISLYLVQIVLAAVLLDAESSWTVAGATFICFVMLTWFSQPLVIPPRFDELYRVGLFLCFAMVAAILVALVGRVNRNLRERDARLAELRQQAAEENHIVRMGLLASGAAHELGTPLASVSVILGDWRRMPEITTRPDMLEELEEMQAAVQRCKTILSGILLSAGEARGEAPAVTTLRDFIDGIVSDWSQAHPGETLRYQPASNLHDAGPIVADPALRQVITNLLENAHEASPAGIELRAALHDKLLNLEVADAGPGFTDEMLGHVGKPYHSTKARQGAGLGLFLVVNVIRKLGGTVTARNCEEGGAAVTIELPLAALRFRDDDRG